MLSKLNFLKKNKSIVLISASEESEFTNGYIIEIDSISKILNIQNNDTR